MSDFTSEMFNSTNVAEIVVAMNTSEPINYWLGHLLLIGIYLFILLALKSQWEFSDSFAAAGFATLVCAVLAWAWGIVPFYDIFVAIVLATIGAIALYLDK